MNIRQKIKENSLALVTSTSILNHTIDAILDATRSCREVVMLGASTPLIPDVFTDTPVTMLSGVVVTRPGEIIRIVSEGGGMRFFKNNIKKENIRLQLSHKSCRNMDRDLAV